MTMGLKANADGSGAIQVGGSDAITITSGLNTTFAGTVTSTGTITSPTGTLYPLVSGTAVASTSGTSIDFTGIPSWVKRITVMFNGVSTTGTSALQVQIGGSGSVENTGYSSNAGVITGIYAGAAGSDSTATTGFLLEYNSQAATDTISGHLVLTNISGNIWVGSGVIGAGANRPLFLFAGTKTTSTTLNILRITTVLGSPTFDAGSINILYE